MRTSKWTEGESGRDAQRGTRIHEGIVKRVRREPTMLDFDEERSVTAAVNWLFSREFKEVRHEVAYSLSRDGTVRRILNTEHRDYGPLTSGEVPGTLDLVCIDDTGLHYVIDWKTGNEVDEPGANWQLLFGACCLARIYDLDEVEVGIAYVRGDHVWYTSEKIGRLTLDRFEKQLRFAMDNASEQYNSGSHCRYCPAAVGCPKQQKSIVALDSEAIESDDFVWTTEFISVANDGKMVERLAGVKHALEEVEKKLKERARASGGIRLSNGKIWKESVRMMPRFQKSKLEALLTPEQIASCIEKREELYFVQKKDK